MKEAANVGQKRTALVIYAILVLAVAFALGFFSGRSQGLHQVHVHVTEAAPPSAEEIGLPAPVQNDGPVDLNAAGQAELETLPGIGPELAARILAYRQTVGRFVAKEQIMDVQGIGEKRFEELEPLITVGGTP